MCKIALGQSQETEYEKRTKAYALKALEFLKLKDIPFGDLPLRMRLSWTDPLYKARKNLESVVNNVSLKSKDAIESYLDESSEMIIDAVEILKDNLSSKNIGKDSVEKHKEMINNIYEAQKYINAAKFAIKEDLSKSLSYEKNVSVFSLKNTLNTFKSDLSNLLSLKEIPDKLNKICAELMKDSEFILNTINEYTTVDINLLVQTFSSTKYFKEANSLDKFKSELDDYKSQINKFLESKQIQFRVR
jgi:hypothetical protein